MFSSGDGGEALSLVGQYEHHQQWLSGPCPLCRGFTVVFTRSVRAWLAPPPGRDQNCTSCSSFPGNDFSGLQCRPRNLTTAEEKRMSAATVVLPESTAETMGCWKEWEGSSEKRLKARALRPSFVYRHVVFPLNQRELVVGVHMLMQVDFGGFYCSLRVSPVWRLPWTEISTSSCVGCCSRTDNLLWVSAGLQTFIEGNPPPSQNLPAFLVFLRVMLRSVTVGAFLKSSFFFLRPPYRNASLSSSVTTLRQKAGGLRRASRSGCWQGWRWWPGWWWGHSSSRNVCKERPPMALTSHCLLHYSVYTPWKLIQRPFVPSELQGMFTWFFFFFFFCPFLLHKRWRALTCWTVEEKTLFN